MMKKMLMVFMLIVLGVVGCSQQGISLESIEENGALVVGLSADYPPFESHKMIDGEDTLVGFDVMLAEEIAKELGVEVQFKEMDFDGLIGALQSSQVDLVISGMSPNPDRLEQADFSEYYYTGQNAVLVRKEDADKYKSVDDLKGIKLGTQLGSIQTPIAEELSDSVKQLKATQDVVLELSNGNVEAIILGSEIASRYAEEFTNIVMSDAKLESAEAMAVAVPKGSEELVSKINEVINSLRTNGTLDEMLEEAIQLSIE